MTDYIGNGETGRAIPKPGDPNIVYGLSTGATFGAATMFTVNNLHKAIEIKDRIAKGQVSKAVIVGGGAIGIEMAEAFKDLWGIDATIVELKSHLLPSLVDWEMADILAKHLRDSGLEVLLAEAALEILGDAIKPMDAAAVQAAVRLMWAVSAAVMTLGGICLFPLHG